MSTPIMFKALDYGQTMGKLLAKPPVQWDISKQRLRYEVGPAQTNWVVQQIFNFIIIGIGSYLYDLAFFAFASNSNPLYLEVRGSPHFVTTRFILSTVYFGGVTFLGGIFIWGNDIVEIVNATLNLERHLKRKTRQRKPKFDLLGYTFIFWLILVPSVPPIVAISTVLRQQDPYRTVLYTLLPSWVLSIPGMKLVLGVLRVFLLTMVALEIARVLLVLAVGVLMVAVLFKTALTLLEQYYDSLSPADKFEPDKFIRFYQQLYLIVFATNKSASFIFLIIQSISLFLFVVFSIIVIKMWEIQTLQIYLIALFLLVAEVILTLVIFPMAAEPNEASLRMRGKWRNSVSKVKVVGGAGEVMRKRYTQKRVKALNIFPLYCGFEEYRCANVTKDSMWEYLEIARDYTINALVTIEM